MCVRERVEFSAHTDRVNGRGAVCVHMCLLCPPMERELILCLLACLENGLAQGSRCKEVQGSTSQAEVPSLFLLSLIARVVPLMEH